MRAGIYARISSDKDDTQLGVKRQEEDCRKHCERRGWTVAESNVYMDNNKSAANPRTKRPEYERLLRDIKDGRLDVVVVWATDRLHRQPAELEGFIQVCDAAGLTLLSSISDGDQDLTDTGLDGLRMRALFAASEVRRIKKRILRKQQELAEKGLPAGGGTRPFGFEEDRITHRKSEAVLIRDAAHRIIQGESLYSIRAHWEKLGVPTVTGAPWSVTGVRATLMRPRVAGRRQYKKEDIGKAAWDPILEPASWEQLRNILNNPSRRQAPPSRSYPLYGILRCGCDCEFCSGQQRHDEDGHEIPSRRLLTAMPRANGRNYGCRKMAGGGQLGCGHVYVAGHFIESHVLGFVLPLVDSPVVLSALATEVHGGQEEVARIVQEIADDEKARAELADDFYQHRVIDRPTFIRQEAKFRDRVEANRKRLATLQSADTLGSLRGRVREAWPTLDREQQRRVLESVLSEVRVKRARRGGNKFDPTRVDIRWKFDKLSEIAGELTASWTPDDWEAARVEYDRLNDEAALN